MSLKGVLTSYTLSLAVFIPISGWMADRFGTKRIFAWAVVLFSLGSLLCGALAECADAGRLAHPAGDRRRHDDARRPARAGAHFPRSELMSAMNYVVIPALIAPLLGPFVGGLMVHWLPVARHFSGQSPLRPRGLWAVRRYMPDYRDAGDAAAGSHGFLLFGAGVALLSYVLEVFGEHGLPAGADRRAGRSRGGAAGRSTAGMPGTPRRRCWSSGCCASAPFASRCSAALSRGIGIGGMPFLLPLLYQVGMGFPAWQAGLFTMPQAIAAMGMKVVGRRLLTRFGHRAVLMANTLALGGAIGLFSFVGRHTPVPAILVLTLLLGFVSSLQFTSMNTLVYADVDDPRCQQGRQHRQHRAADVAQLWRGLRRAAGGVVFLGGGDQRLAAQTVPALHKAFRDHGRGDGRLGAHLPRPHRHGRE